MSKLNENKTRYLQYYLLKCEQDKRGFHQTELRFVVSDWEEFERELNLDGTFENKFIL